MMECLLKISRFIQRALKEKFFLINSYRLQYKILITISVRAMMLYKENAEAPFPE